MMRQTCLQVSHLVDVWIGPSLGLHRLFYLVNVWLLGEEKVRTKVTAVTDPRLP